MSETPSSEFTSGIRAGYDRWAQVYDHDANPLPALEEPFVQRAIGEASGLDVLDLGCGTGRHALRLAAAGARVTAVDFSAGMLAAARAKAGAAAIQFLVHDLHLPLALPEGSFDLVVSGLVLEHLRDLGEFFQESRRMLRPEGRAVISAMHPAMFLRGSQARFTDPESGQVIQPGSLAHQLGDFVMAAVQAGFGIDRIGEHAPDAAFAARYPRAEKYVGWPMLVVLELRASVMRPGPSDAQSGDEQSQKKIARLVRSVREVNAQADPLAVPRHP
jgi:malonyl-CoA O-methyltransferase